MRNRADAPPLRAVAVVLQCSILSCGRRSVGREQLVGLLDSPAPRAKSCVLPKAIDRLTRSDDGYAPMGSDGQQVLAISSDGQLGPGGDDRGFTGHEHLDELGFVHMNGRIYDPLLGRFLSPDPLIQAAELLQNYNRYSYVLNNPLRHTDPSGEYFWHAVAFIVGAALASSDNKDLKIIGSIMMMAALGPGVTAEPGLLHLAAGAEKLLPAVVSFASATIANTIAYGPEAGIKAGLFAAAFTGAGGISASLSPELVIAHALLGCAQQASSGGQCGPGAAAAAFGKIATGLTDGIESGPAQFAIATIVGGTASVIGGGKFANGAAQAGFGYLFNHRMSKGDIGRAYREGRGGHHPFAKQWADDPEFRPLMTDDAVDAAGARTMGNYVRMSPSDPNNPHVWSTRDPINHVEYNNGSGRQMALDWMKANGVSESNPMTRGQMERLITHLQTHPYNVSVQQFINEQVKQGNIIWGRSMGRGGYRAPE
jgi:RHS repeat-associated protein